MYIIKANFDGIRQLKQTRQISLLNLNFGKLEMFSIDGIYCMGQCVVIVQ